MGPETGTTGQWKGHQFSVVTLAFNISCSTYSPVFTLFSHLFFHLTLPYSFVITHFLSFFLQSTRLDSCFLEATIDSVHLLLSSACYFTTIGK